MAKKVIIVDDIDGTEGDGIVTHRFSLGSDFYEIDLCPQNLLSLRTALEPFVSAGRRVRGGNRRKPEPAPRQQGNSALDFPHQQPLAIRNWARTTAATWPTGERSPRTCSPPTEKPARKPRRRGDERGDEQDPRCRPRGGGLLRTHGQRRTRPAHPAATDLVTRKRAGPVGLGLRRLLRGQVVPRRHALERLPHRLLLESAALHHSRRPDEPSAGPAGCGGNW